LENIFIGDYFLQNFTSKNLAVFLANENEDNYYNFISLVIGNVEDLMLNNIIINADNNNNNEKDKGKKKDIENHLMCNMKLLLNIIYNIDDRKNKNISLIIKCAINVFNFSKVILNFSFKII
jgi:hypothetical protein